MTYEERKNKIQDLMNQFQGTDDMFPLAESIIDGMELLKVEGFPYKEYNKWKNENKSKKI